MKSLLVVALLLCATVAYDFSTPEKGNELFETLLNEPGDVIMAFFHTPNYEDKDNNEMATNIKQLVQDECRTMKLNETQHYMLVDVSIELEGTKEKDHKKPWGQLLYDLGFEDGNPPEGDAAAAGGDGAAGGDNGGAAGGADNGGATTRRLFSDTYETVRRKLQGDAGGDGAAAGGDGAAAGGDGAAASNPDADRAAKLEAE